MTTREEQKKTEILAAVVLKQIYEINSALRGEPVNDIPVEAFLPENEEEEIL